MNRNKILELKNVNKHYYGKNETLHIIRDFSLEILEGEFITILGKSGSGKSTLLNLIGLLDKPDDNGVYLEYKDMGLATEKEKNYIKNEKIGFVFQFHYLLPEFTALENVMIPALLKNYSDKEKIQEKAMDLLEKVGLKSRSHHKPSELSGGEKQSSRYCYSLLFSPW